MEMWDHAAKRGGLFHKICAISCSGEILSRLNSCNTPSDNEHRTSRFLLSHSVYLLGNLEYHYEMHGTKAQAGKLASLDHENEAILPI